MKKYILTGALALCAMAGAQAQTDIFVTGATAFRGGFSNAMNNTTVGFFVGGPATSAVDVTPKTATIAKFGVWTGNVTGITGLVRVYASFSGSVEGIRDLTTGNTTTPFFPASIATAGGNVSVTAGNATLLSASDFAFSDAFQASTPYKTPLLINNNAGILPFVMVTNENAPAGFTNVLANQFSTLFKVGYLKLSVFTGNFSHDTTQVFATGRYDLSGTRIIYLAETGSGIGTPLSQYKPIGNNTTVTALRLWPTGDGLNASTVDQPGNGGWEGSSSVRNFMGSNTSAVEIQYEDSVRNDDFPNATYNTLMLSSVGSGDVATIVSTGGKALAYNGGLYASGAGGTITADDNARVYNGAYTLWGYEHLYNLSTLSGPKLTARARLLTNFDNPSILGTNGLRVSLMKVSRSVDGGPVTPIAQF